MLLAILALLATMEMGVGLRMRFLSFLAYQGLFAFPCPLIFTRALSRILVKGGGGGGVVDELDLGPDVSVASLVLRLIGQVNEISVSETEMMLVRSISAYNNPLAHKL